MKKEKKKKERTLHLDHPAHIILDQGFSRVNYVTVHDSGECVAWLDQAAECCPQHSKKKKKKDSSRSGDEGRVEDSSRSGDEGRVEDLSRSGDEEREEEEERKIEEERFIPFWGRRKS